MSVAPCCSHVYLTCANSYCSSSCIFRSIPLKENQYQAAINQKYASCPEAILYTKPVTPYVCITTTFSCSTERQRKQKLSSKMCRTIAQPWINPINNKNEILLVCFDFSVSGRLKMLSVCLGKSKQCRIAVVFPYERNRSEVL